MLSHAVSTTLTHDSTVGQEEGSLPSKARCRARHRVAPDNLGAGAESSFRCSLSRHMQVDNMYMVIYMICLRFPSSSL